MPLPVPFVPSFLPFSRIMTEHSTLFGPDRSVILLLFAIYDGTIIDRLLQRPVILFFLDSIGKRSRNNQDSRLNQGCCNDQDGRGNLGDRNDQGGRINLGGRCYVVIQKNPDCHSRSPGFVFIL